MICQFDKGHYDGLLPVANGPCLKKSVRDQLICRFFEPGAAAVSGQERMPQFSRKRTRRFKHPSDFIDPSATPRKLLLIPIEPSSFPLARLCVRADARYAACDDQVRHRDQQTIGDVDSDRLCAVYGEQAAPELPIAESNVVGRAAECAKFIE